MKKTPRASKKIGTALKSPRNTESPRTSPLARRQRRAAGLHFEKHHPPHLPIREAVEYDEIDRAAQEPRVLGIEPEFGEIGDKLLVHLARGDGQAALHRIVTNRGAVAEFPDEEIEPRDHAADRDADEETAVVVNHAQEM